jgi:hypothetical protein
LIDEEHEVPEFEQVVLVVPLPTLQSKLFDNKNDCELSFNFFDSINSIKLINLFSSIFIIF